MRAEYQSTRSHARSNRHTRRLVACLGLTLALWACGPATPSPTPTFAFTLPEIETVADLEAELERAGLRVSVGEAEGTYPLSVPPAQLAVGDAQLLIFEYPLDAERRADAERFSPDGLAFDGEPVVWPDRPIIWAVGQLIVVYPGTDGGLILVLNGLMGDPLNMPAPSVDEPYPPAVSQAISTLAEELDLEPGRIVVVSFEVVEWPDGCLGLGQPDEACLAVITPGWRVELQVGEARYQLRTSELGEQVRLEGGVVP